ncbi:MAG: response regulator [Thermodesulfobacteriota bacterium]
MRKSEKFYTTGEIASLSHVTINAVKKWINAGKLSAFKTPGGHHRVRSEEFRAFLSKYRFHLAEDIFPQKYKILIVDDEPAVLELMKDSLASSEANSSGAYEIMTASDGYDALIKVGTFRPDILVLDINMPRLDGFEVCRRLRSGGSTKDIKILAVTAYGDEDAKKALSTGADFCMRKPLDVAAFRKRVEMLLNVKPAQSQAWGTHARGTHPKDGSGSGV